MGKYRDRLQIIADILSVVAHARSPGAKKTHIMYRANLSYTLLNRYLTEVLEAKLIRSGNGECYQLTRRGHEFLSRLANYFERCTGLEQVLSQVNIEKTKLENVVNQNLESSAKANAPSKRKL